MQVSLTPELENQVRLKVESGLYGDASEVVNEALRVFLEPGAQVERLREEIAIGMAQLSRGEGIRVGSKEEFLRLVKED